MKYYVYSKLGGPKPDGYISVNSHLIRVKLDRGNPHRPKYPRGMTRYIYDIVKVVSEDKVPGIELLVNLSIQPKDILDFPSDEAALLWFKMQPGTGVQEEE
jgi:hypothetical protein